MARLPSLNLSSVAELIFKRAEETAEDRRSNGIGISTLGDDCSRRVWYDFRWASPLEKFDGRMLKLFETGNREEARLVNELRSAGLLVHDKDPERKDEPQKQFRVERFGGHVSGYLDGICRRGIPEIPNEEAVLECKTHNKKNFEKLKDKGVRRSHAKHYAQCIMGMGLRGLSWALYFAKNKDDDDRHTELVAFDQKAFDDLESKAEAIVFSNAPPERAGATPWVPPCLYVSNDGKEYPCQHRAMCHASPSKPVAPEVNCRTCLHSEPKRDGTWMCKRHEKPLAKDEQEAGCENHLWIPELLPFGRPIQVDKTFVLYENLMINREGGRLTKVERVKGGA